jgi:hypothetical protein
MPKRKPGWINYGRKDDCLTACVSKLLNINYDEVPFYGKDSASDDWLAKLSKWANKKGHKMYFVWRDNLLLSSLPEKLIGVGKSPSGKPCDHATLINNNLKVIWDPAYNKKRSIKDISYVLIFKEL